MTVNKSGTFFGVGMGDREEDRSSISHGQPDAYCINYVDYSFSSEEKTAVSCSVDELYLNSKK